MLPFVTLVLFFCRAHTVPVVRKVLLVTRDPEVCPGLKDTTDFRDFLALP